MALVSFSPMTLSPPPRRSRASTAPFASPTNSKRINPIAAALGVSEGTLSFAGVVMLFGSRLAWEDYRRRVYTRLERKDLHEHLMESIPTQYLDEVGPDVVDIICEYLEEPEAVRQGPMYPSLTNAIRVTLKRAVRALCGGFGGTVVGARTLAALFFMGCFQGFFTIMVDALEGRVRPRSFSILRFWGFVLRFGVAEVRSVSAPVMRINFLIGAAFGISSCCKRHAIRAGALACHRWSPAIYWHYFAMYQALPTLHDSPQRRRQLHYRYVL